MPAGNSQSQLKRVAVIGYGMVGMTVVEFLDRTKFDVHVYDLENSYSKPKFFPDPEGPNSLRHSQSMPVGSPGNAWFWGSAVTNALHEIKHWPTSFITKIPRYSKQLRKLGFPKIKLEILNQEMNQLKVRYAKTDKFLAKVGKKRDMNSFSRHRALVRVIEVEGNRVNIQSVSEDDLLLKESFDIVIVCCGSINSFNLLKGSQLVPNSEVVHFFDHPTFTFGNIRTLKSKWVRNRMRNKFITHGRRPGAFVLRVDPTMSATVRIRPIIRSKKFRLKDSGIRASYFKVLNKIHSYLSLCVCRDFSVAVTLDFHSGQLVAMFDSEGYVKSLNYVQLFKFEEALVRLIEDKIKESIGEFEKSWTAKLESLHEGPSAHYAGFCTNTAGPEGISVVDDFRLIKNKQIFVPGATAFPHTVYGHPTYLSLLSAVHVAEQINNEWRIQSISKRFSLWKGILKSVRQSLCLRPKPIFRYKLKRIFNSRWARIFNVYAPFC